MNDLETPGLYQLNLWLAHPVTIQVGRLGRFLFPAGRYIYTGSALNGLERRIARHRRRHKRLFWHIDYLLEYARIQDAVLYPTRERGECALNAHVLARPEARVVVRGFGASDCRCATHLVYLEDETAKAFRGARDTRTRG